MFDPRGPRIDTQTNARRCMRVSATMVELEHPSQTHIYSVEWPPAPSPSARNLGVVGPRTAAKVVKVATPIEQLVKDNVLYNIAIDRELRHMLEVCIAGPYERDVQEARAERDRWQMRLNELIRRQNRFAALPWWRRVLVALRNDWETV